MGWDGWDGILLRSLVQLEHLAVLIRSTRVKSPNNLFPYPANRSCWGKMLTVLPRKFLWQEEPATKDVAMDRFMSARWRRKMGS